MHRSCSSGQWDRMKEAKCYIRVFFCFCFCFFTFFLLLFLCWDFLSKNVSIPLFRLDISDLPFCYGPIYLRGQHTAFVTGALHMLMINGTDEIRISH